MIIVATNAQQYQEPVQVVSFQNNGLAGYSGDTTWGLPTYSPGDMVVAFIGHYFGPTPPTGSSTVPSFVRAGYDGTNGISVYYGLLPNSGMSMGYWNSSGFWCFNYVVFRRFKTASPIGGIQLSYSTGSITSATAPGVTMQNTNGSSALVSFIHTYRYTSGLSISATTPGSWTNHFCNAVASPNGTSHGVGAFTLPQATSSTANTFATYSAAAPGDYHKAATIEVLAA